MISLILIIMIVMTEEVLFVLCLFSDFLLFYTFLASDFQVRSFFQEFDNS